MMTLSMFGIRYSFNYLMEFLSNYKDIFILKSYYFESKSDSPYIIDCGSHIGISVLYFKYLYPGSRVLAFEANPMVFKLLKKNIRQNNSRGVRLVHAAVGARDGSISFYAANKNVGHSLGDSTVQNFWYNETNYDTLTVPSKRLSAYITKPVDLLNLDIEGAEGAVLREIESKLGYINEIFMEYHGNIRNRENNLKDILKLLHKHNFSFTIREPATLLYPLRRSLQLRDLPHIDGSFLIIKAKKIKK